jgi:transmembrane sensor
MSDQADLTRAEAEASDWFTVLKRTKISIQALDEFWDWKRDPTNADAFKRVERAWKASGRLANDPDIKAAAAEASRRNPLPRATVRWQAGFPVAAAVVIALAAGSIWYMQSAATSYATRVGEQRLVALSDGSHVRLNTDSQISVRFRQGERRVVLEKGEAFFDVAHDAGRPFVVAADGIHVRALGTKFDVRRDAAAVQVTLLQGRVQVAQTGQPMAELTPNQQLTATPQGLSAPRAADAAEASSWTTGRLRFRDVPLRQAVAEVNRYSSRKVVLEGSPSLAAEPVSGEFDVGDTGAFVTALTVSFDLQESGSSPAEIRLVPRTAGPAG